jgi:hypothetical protein
LAAHDQVGDGLHAVGAHLGFGNRVFLGFETEGLDEFGGAFGMRRVVAGRRVGGHAYELLEEGGFLVEMGVYPAVEPGVISGEGHVGQARDG